jgi:uncharacterized protein YkwD
MPTPRVVRRKRAVKAGFGLLALSLAATLIGRLYLIYSSPPSPEKMAALSDQESEILSRVNLERVHAGLRPLRFAAKLAVIARGHSYDMAMRRYLDHSSPDGIGPAERLRGAGISYDAVGENIYMGDYREDATMPARAVERWLASAEHRATILSREFTDTGVGVARSPDGSIYVTQDFIR